MSTYKARADVVLSETELAQMREAHRDSYPMGNFHHATDANPEWGTFCVECTDSWPCDVSRLLATISALDGER